MLVEKSDVLRDIVLPFKGIFVDVEGIADEVCLEKFSPRLGAFIIALKYAREQREALERKVADRDALIADRDAENASLVARIKELEAALAAKNG